MSSGDFQVGWSLQIDFCPPKRHGSEKTHRCYLFVDLNPLLVSRLPGFHEKGQIYNEHGSTARWFDPTDDWMVIRKPWKNSPDGTRWKKKGSLKSTTYSPQTNGWNLNSLLWKGRFIFQTFIFGFQPFVFGGVVGRVRSLRRLTSKAPEGRCNFGGLFPRADWNCSFEWWHVYIYIHIYPRSKDFLWNCWKKLRWTSSFFLLIDKDNPLQSLQQWNPETNIRFFGAMKILCPQLRHEVKLKTWKMRINQ